MKKLIIICLTLIIVSCSSVSITDRKQLILLGDEIIYPEAFKAYATFKSKNKLIKEGKEFETIQKVTNNIKIAINNYYKRNGKDDPTSNFRWEVILVNNKKIKNAWCMPGGKIAVYSGILDVANNENALAALMGHEIAHAVARHGSERASQSMMLDIGTTAIEKVLIGRPLSENYRNLYQHFSTFGIMLPFSRSHEAEADFLGLVFMYLAGYEMKEAVNMWERMKKSNSRKSIPEFLSTHPSSKNRIKNITNWIPIIKEKYKNL